MGVALDVGATYTDTAHGFTLSAVISNFGTELKAYTPGDMAQLPFAAPEPQTIKTVQNS